LRGINRVVEGFNELSASFHKFLTISPGCFFLVISEPLDKVLVTMGSSSSIENGFDDELVVLDWVVIGFDLIEAKVGNVELRRNQFVFEVAQFVSALVQNCFYPVRTSIAVF
jgi:hypothetical protein